MSFAKTYSSQVHMLSAETITVEADLSRGLHAFTVVGLPDKAVEESRDRVSAAIKNSGFTPPKAQNRKIVISLAPADIKKEGPCFDVAIALAYLLAADEIRFDAEKKLFIGELSLDGDVRPVRGILAIALKAKERGFEEVYVPKGNAAEAALIDGIKIFAVENLLELIRHLDAKDKQKHKLLAPQPKTEIDMTPPRASVDFADIRGQEHAKRGLEIAAAGGHNVALWGPPGTGKTLLAKGLAGILPPLSFEHMLEVTSIHSIAGSLRDALITHPPFRSPHHTSSYVSLVGGGAVPKPGEITLAHRGVLFLDEFPEFERRVVEALRQPLEERTLSVARARGTAEFPADVLLIAAMNPCPCGNWGSEDTVCTCHPQLISRYQRKISGPLIDRIDMWLAVPRFSHELLSGDADAEPSEQVRERVRSARGRQEERFAGTRMNKNSDMGAKDLKRHVKLAESGESLLNAAAARLGLSARGYHRIMKLARTIADLDGASDIRDEHLLEAIQYRPQKLFSVE